MMHAVSNIGFSGGGVGLKSVGALAQSAVPASVTGTTIETVLATIVIPAGSVGSNGSIRILSLWSYTNSANNKVLKGVVGGTAFMSVTSTSTGSLQQETMLRNRGEQNSQVAFSPFFAGGIGVTANAVLSSAVNFSVAQTMTLTGTLSNTSETITLEGYTVEILNP